MYSSVLFSVRERKSPAESFLKFKQNVEFPTGAVRAKFVFLEDLGAWKAVRKSKRQRVVRNVVRVKQMRVRADGSGSWVVPRILFVPCMETCRGLFFLRAGKVSIEEISEACFRKFLVMRTRPRPSDEVTRLG